MNTGSLEAARSPVGSTGVSVRYPRIQRRNDAKQRYLWMSDLYRLIGAFFHRVSRIPTGYVPSYLQRGRLMRQWHMSTYGQFARDH